MKKNTLFIAITATILLLVLLSCPFYETTVKPLQNNSPSIQWIGSGSSVGTRNTARKGSYLAETDRGFMSDFAAREESDGSFYRLGEVLKANGYTNEAVETYEKGVREDAPNVGTYVIALGDIYRTAGNFQDFLEYAIYATNMYPNDNSLYKSVADFFLQNKEPLRGLIFLDSVSAYQRGNDEFENFYQEYKPYAEKTMRGE